jgi:hypothetical protein
MVGHALWFDECPNNFHEDDGKYIEIFHQFFCGGVFGLHSHQQQELGGTLATYSTGYAHSAVAQAI